MKNLTRFRPALAALCVLAVAPLTFGQTIPPSLAAPPGSVNTNIPGMKMRIVQGNASTPQSNAAAAEALISEKRLDPTTGLPLNLATPNPADGSFVYTIDTYLNTHEQAETGATGGNFSTAAAAPHNVPDDPELGIPGTTGSGDYFVMEFTGFLQLPAGTVRFGVNSDDGFKLTIGTGVQPSIQALQLMILDGTRGFGNTEANITVTQAGIYPFRLLFWENTGAASGIEFYTFAPGTTSGNRYLVNDRSQANAIRSYREAAGNPPSIRSATPSLTAYVDVQGNPAGVPPAPYMWVELVDGTTTVNTNSIRFSLDGTALPTVISKAGNITTVGAQAPLLGASTVHTNTLIYADSAGSSSTNIWAFTVSAYPTVLAEYAVPSVDTSKPGFRAKVYQIDVNRNPATGIVPNAERQIAGGYIDPATGLPYPNTANLADADADGYFVEPGVINWNEGAPAATGNFSSGSTPAFEDMPVPGIGPESPNTTERYVFSIETILELKAGAYRFGVNSDDGFRLSAGRGPGDVVGVQLGTAGDRGVVNSFMDFVIPADGLYPFRLMWWETGGGSAAEFFVVDLATGNLTLINDLTGATPIKAFRESAASRPSITRVLPAVNYGYTFADQDLIIDVTDGAIPLDANSAVLTLNGAAQTLTAAKSGKVTTLTRKSSVTAPLPSGTVSARLVYSSTSGGTTTSATNNWSFIVPRYTVPIPPANKVLASQVSGSGFTVRASQIDRSKDANQGNGGRHSGSNMPGPEIQLDNGYIDPVTNQPYPNLAPAGPLADGFYDVPDVLNFNNAQSAGGPAANAGIFNLDTATPGLPGTGTSNFGLDNSAHEFITYLELKAGAYVFGVNVDDGWLVASAPNPRDTLGTLLGFRNAPGGQNGNPAHNPNAAFNVLVPEDGIYPFRILFWQGGGGVNIEFFSIDRNTGTQILVNDTAGAVPSVVATSGQLNSPVKAYNTYSGPTRPWTKFSVYPMPYIGTTHPTDTSGGAVTLWQNRNQQSGPGPIQVKLGLLNGSWNSGEVANSSTAQRPFGDAVGAIIAALGTSPVGMVLDGAAVTPLVSDIANSTDKLVIYTPSSPLSATSNHVAGLVYAGTTNYWTFSVITNVTVQASDALPSTAANPSARGFKAKIVQAAAGRPGGNTAAAAEAQLAGTPANVALPGSEPDGAYILPGVINWNSRKVTGQTGAEIGNFQTLLGGPADDPIPGLPGTGLTGAGAKENATAEVFAYLDLPAGYQKFGVNGDDGWKVQIGSPGQTNGTVLFTIDRGAGSQDIPFAFITPQAGLYPVRLVWYQGGGDGSLEFFTYGPNNQKIAVNDASNPNAVKAYYRVSTVAQPQIALTRQANGTLRITFDGTLQETDSLGPISWRNVSNATSPFDVTPTANQRYYRSVAP